MNRLNSKTCFFTALAILGFAANSLLTRPALDGGMADPASFALIRVASGAVMLALLVVLSKRHALKFTRKNLPMSFFLFLYMILFSFAYARITIGAGSLIAFSCVQITMLSGGFFRGDRLGPLGWMGFTAAMGGLIYLMSPGLSAPPLAGALLMVGAGTAWGFYSLYGTGAKDPLVNTAANFIFAIPFGVIVFLIFIKDLNLTRTGILFAVLSGSLSSALGYAFWYAALRGLTATQAAIVQILAPLVAAAGGILFLGEILQLRLIIAAPLILGGIFLAFKDDHKAPPQTTKP